MEGNMTRLVFSLLLSIENKKDCAIDDVCLDMYYEYKDQIVKMQCEYAEYCGADYRLIEDHDYYTKEFYPEYKERFPYVTDFDIIQYYKIKAFETFCDHYDEVLFLDFDVLPGNKRANFFEEFDLSELFAIRQTQLPGEADELADLSSQYRKGLITRFLLNRNNFMRQWIDVFNFNTGVMGGTKKSFASLDYFDTLHEILPIINEHGFQQIRDIDKDLKGGSNIIYSNEIAMTYTIMKDEKPYQNIEYEWNYDIAKTDKYYLHHCQQHPILNFRLTGKDPEMELWTGF